MKEGRAAFAANFDVSRETMDALDAYELLLVKWNRRINLVSPRSLDALWTRHFADSAQILDISPDSSQSWADLGSGGGFPGAVIAILARASRPNLKVTLVESDQRKAAFLRALSRETSAPYDVIDRRVESLDPMACDVVSARALAPLPELLGYAATHLNKHGIAILPKGANAASEVELARKTWSFTIQSYPSMTDPQAAILKIGEIKRV